MKTKGTLTAVFLMLLVLSGSAYGLGEPYNTVLGDGAGYYCDTCQYDTFIGYYAGFSTVSTPHNTYVGAFSGSGSVGSDNTFIGSFAGQEVHGSQNTFVGKDAGGVDDQLRKRKCLYRVRGGLLYYQWK